MPRFYCNVYLAFLKVNTSGDVFSKEGEWFLTVNKARFPDVGHVKLSAGETFQPPDPPIYTCMLGEKDKEFKFTIKVKEEDRFSNDTYLKQTFSYPLTPMKERIDLSDKKGRVAAQIIVTVQAASAW